MHTNDSENSKPKHGGGPKTPEGKARSANNALRHGLTGSTVVIAGEDPKQFQELLDNYIAHFRPSTIVEMDLVHELAVCRWRIQRCWTMESNMFDITVGRNKSAVECEFKACSRDMQFTLAFMKMADEGRAMSLLHRYETRLTRRYNQVMRDLDRLQSKPPREDDDHVTPETLPTARPQNCQSNSETAPAASSKIPSDGQKRPSIYLPPGIRRFHSRDPRTGKACEYVDLPVDPITGALRT